MPTGEHLTRCLECGASFVCGDCITDLCLSCQCKKGNHLRLPSGMCGRCGATVPVEQEEIPFPPWTRERYEARKALKEWCERTTPE